MRVYHGGRSQPHRARERALTTAEVDVTLVVPICWPEGGGEEVLSSESFPIVELPVRRSGDVNRHAYTDSTRLARLLRDVSPDVFDIHEEPFSVAARQWLAAAPPDLPVVMYAAQNLDKRFPPPFSHYERAAHRRVASLYPCSAQAASVARGKGFAGPIEVLPLGYDDAVFFPGAQSLAEDEVVLALAGRLVPEKGVADAVDVVARVNAARPARLVIVGNGPEEEHARAQAVALGVANRVELVPWQTPAVLAETYRRAHVVLVPSRTTASWVEQFGRVIVEAQASGAVVAGYSSGTIADVAGPPGITVPEGDVDSLARAVAAVLADPADFAHRRDMGIALAATRTWAQVAERQVNLYRRVVAGDVPRARLPSSPRRRRELARAEFGPTVATTAGSRPFALPLLRRGSIIASALARILDAAAELSAAFVSRMGTSRQ